MRAYIVFFKFNIGPYVLDYKDFPGLCKIFGRFRIPRIVHFEAKYITRARAAIWAISAHESVLAI